MNEQNPLREKVLELHNIYGTPYAFIAKNIGVSKECISRWVNGHRNLSQKLYDEVENFVNSLGKRY